MADRTLTPSRGRAPVFGLVLAGGRSRRMQADKATLAFHGRPQIAATFELVAARVDRAFVSVRPDQAGDPLRAAYPLVIDAVGCHGPLAGLIAAQATWPAGAWLVVACDLPLLDGATLDQLLAERRPHGFATAFRSATDGLPEPLCAIYEPASRSPLLDYAAAGGRSPREFLLAHDVALLDARRPAALANANTPADAEDMRRRIAGAP